MAEGTRVLKAEGTGYTKPPGREDFLASREERKPICLEYSRWIEKNKVILNEMNENKADHSSALNRYENNSVKVNRENSMMSWIKHFEQRLVYIGAWFLFFLSPFFDLLWVSRQSAASSLFNNLAGNFYSSSNFV